MSKQYIPKQFTPFVYPEWGELFEDLTPEQSREILLAITKYPEYEPKNVSIWKFIKSQLNKDYENFTAKCLKRGEAARNYWGNKGEQMLSIDNKSIPSEYKGEPKPLTTNHLPLTTNCNIPTKKQIEDYCRELGRGIDVDAFIEYYAAGDWLDENGFPIKNWKRKVISWHSRERKKREPEPVCDGLF